MASPEGRAWTLFTPGIFPLVRYADIIFSRNYCITYAMNISTSLQKSFDEQSRVNISCVSFSERAKKANYPRFNNDSSIKIVRGINASHASRKITIEGGKKQKNKTKQRLNKIK